MPKSNSELYPEVWKIFVEQARNISEEKDICHLGTYRIPNPDKSGNFLYSDHPGKLFTLFKDEYYKPSLDSPSVYGKIQAIVTKFK